MFCLVSWVCSVWLGRCSVQEFFTLLKKGNPDFLERQAELLFRAADEDLSGTVDFAEFVDFLFQSKDQSGHAIGTKTLPF
eukprot:3055636-Amphidinium_carterae.1